MERSRKKGGLSTKREKREIIVKNVVTTPNRVCPLKTINTKINVLSYIGIRY